MADDRFSDSSDESEEPTSNESAPGSAADETSTPGELTDSGEIVDPKEGADDAYVDDPRTADINEAKLGRATDEVIDEQGADESAAAVPGRRGSGRTRTTAPVRKKNLHRSGADAVATPGTGRTAPVKFVTESVGELRKVVWPTGTQLQQYFIVVLVFVLFIMAIVSVLDLAFGWVILNVFG